MADVFENRTGTGTINDNDVAPVTLAIGNASATEGGNLVFTVTRSGNTGIAASASYATASGTATSGSDFTAASGTVSFTSGQTSKTITVATTDDSATESTETMTVTLSSPGANTTITTATGTGTINDNDTLIQLTDSNLNVLSAHQSTYSCDSGYIGDPYNIDWAVCWINSTSQTVYSDTPYVAPGYSFDAYGPPYGILWVQPQYYGTIP